MKKDLEKIISREYYEVLEEFKYFNKKLKSREEIREYILKCKPYNLSFKSNENNKYTRILEENNIIKSFISYTEFNQGEREFFITYFKSYEKGYGKILLEEFIEFSKNKGVNLISLIVFYNGNNKKLSNYYKKFGFEIKEEESTNKEDSYYSLLELKLKKKDYLSSI
jgi:L-amino acid N-acyltransferase YncA